MRSPVVLHSLILLLAGLLTSCSPYSVTGRATPLVEPPTTFTGEQGPHGEIVYEGRQWWKKFGDERLDALLITAIDENYSLQVAWERFQAAQGIARVVGSERFPQVTAGAGVTRSRFEPGSARFGGADIPIGSESKADYQSRYLVQSGLSYEVDLWKRISSAVTAQELKVEAAGADFENAQQLLAGTVTELWFRAQHQRALLNLLQQQIATSETLLELTELRFLAGRGNVIDVLQQKQQLAALQVEVPGVEGNYAVLLNQLAVLIGKVPGALGDEPSGVLPDLPAFPELIRPVDLLQTRPDLRKASFDMQAQEYEVAAVFAERFPRLSVGLSYEFSTLDSSRLFTDEVGRVFSDLALPVIDGGRRRAQVDVSEAEYRALVADFSERFLLALGDVEDSIARERSQGELLQRLQLQVELARRTLKESQVRYANGLSDYVPVILAIQSVQELERREILEQRDLLIARSRLYRALGDQDTHIAIDTSVALVGQQRASQGVG